MEGDYGITPATAGAVEIGGTASGSIETIADRDGFAFDVVPSHPSKEKKLLQFPLKLEIGPALALPLSN